MKTIHPQTFSAFKGYQLFFWVLLGVLMACTPAPNQRKVVRIEITPGALLLTRAGESQTLSAKAFDAQGNEIKANFTWSSSSTAHATVDSSGKVVAVSALGSAQITAEAAGVKSFPALVMIAEPAPGTVLVSDAQVLGEPQPVDPGQPGGVGFRVKATLAVPALPPGTPVLASESKSLAGKVVSSTPAAGGTEVVLEVRPLPEMFRNLSVRAGGAFAGVKSVSVQNYGLKDKRVMPQEVDRIGPLSCKREMEGKLEYNLFEVEPKASLGNWDLIFEVEDFEPKHIRVKADISAGVSLSGGIKISNMLSGKVDCETTEPIFTVPVPITGALSQVVSPVVPVHGAFSVKGEIAYVPVDLRAKGEINATATVGFEFTPSNGLTNLSNFDTNQDFLKGSIVEPIFGLNSSVRISAEGFVGFRPKISFGNRFFALDFLELDVGAALGFDLSTVAQQATNPDYASEQYLKVKAETTLSDDIGDLFKLLMSEARAEQLYKLIRDGVVKIGFKGEIGIATSPKAMGNMTVDKQTYRKDDKLIFRVKLDPNTINFLIYNVRRIEIYKNPDNAIALGLTPLATAVAREGQTDFQLEWVATEDGTSQDQFFAFVVPNIPPSLPLELGKIIPATGCIAATGVRYCITNLGTLGGSNSYAWEINESGQVVGQTRNASGQYRAFVWQSNQMTDLGTLGGNSSEAYGINESGQIVGSSRIASGQERAFLWQNGQMTDLGTFGGSFSLARKINSSGQIVGWAANSSGQARAFLWQNGQMTNLGTLGGSISAAYAVNDTGQVVGESHTSSGEFRAFLWQNGQMTNLGTLGGSQSEAYAINNNAQVVGFSTNSNGQSRAFLWRNGQMTDLGTLGGRSSTALGINDQGVVVGSSENSNNLPRAFVWRDGQMSDLNSLIDPSQGWLLREATDINNSGQIVGWGSFNGQTRAFLLTPAQ